LVSDIVAKKYQTNDMLISIPDTASLVNLSMNTYAWLCNSILSQRAFLKREMEQNKCNITN